MKRQRFVALMLAMSCVGLAGTVMSHFRVPLVSPVSAQDSRPSESFEPMTGGHLAIATPAVRKAAAASILAQLQAFKKNDYEKAIQYQSSNLKHNFGSPDQFRHMITSAYPEFANYKSVQFGEARSDPRGQRVIVQVSLTGQNGVKVKAIYMMVKEDNVYHVEGVIGGSQPHMPFNPSSNVNA